MFYHTESKMQNWRALAVLEDGSEYLIYLGRSSSQVRAGYGPAYAELLDAEERAGVQRIVLQCWQGAADQGCWVAMADLAIPDRKLTAAASKQPVGDANPDLLPFRRPAEVPAASRTRKALGL